MTEDELLQLVLELASWMGLLRYHTRDSRRSAPGFPDLVIAGRAGVIFAELKSDTGELSIHQNTWRYVLLASGQRWQLWRPADWKAGRIHKALQEIDNH